MMSSCDLPVDLPLFPLAGALLLPRSTLPLHVFETRYVEMVEDCLATPHRLIGLVQPCQCQGRAMRLAPIGCAGRLTAFSETEDGRYMITLTGISRFRLMHDVEAESAYRRGAVSWECFARDLGPAETDPEFDRGYFVGLLEQYFHGQGLEGDWPELCGCADEFLINALSCMLPFSAADKQALLEAPSLTTRREALVTLLRIGIQGDCAGAA